MKFFGVVKPDYLVNAFITPIFVDKGKIFVQKINYNNNLILDFAVVQVEEKYIVIINHTLLQQEINTGDDAIFAYRSDSFDKTVIGRKDELDEILLEFLYRDFDKNPFPKVIISNFMGLHGKTLWYVKETNVFLKKQPFDFTVNPHNYLPDEKEETFDIYRLLTNLQKIEKKTTETSHEFTFMNYIGFYKEKMHINYVYYDVNEIYDNLIDTISEVDIVSTNIFKDFISVLKDYVKNNDDNNDFAKLDKWQKLFKKYDNKEDKEVHKSGLDFLKEQRKFMSNRLMV